MGTRSRQSPSYFWPLFKLVVLAIIVAIAIWFGLALLFSFQHAVDGIRQQLP